MKQSINTGKLKNISESLQKVLSGPAKCPTTGDTGQNFNASKAFGVSAIYNALAYSDGTPGGASKYYTTFGQRIITSAVPRIFLRGVGSNYFGYWLPNRRWKITITLNIYRKKVANPSNPARDWLFCNLVRLADPNYYTVNGINPNLEELIQKDANGKALFFGGTPNSGIPANAIPSVSSDPNQINSTWKWNLATVNASPSAPYTFTDSIVVSEQMLYCMTLFYAQFYEFNTKDSYDIFTLTGVNPFPPADMALPGASLIGSVGERDPYGQFGPVNPSPQIPPTLPGCWDIPLPAYLQNGAIDISNVGDLNTFLNTNYPGWNNPIRLWDVSFSVSLYPSKVYALFTFAVIGKQIRFTDVSSGGPNSWSWNFGDGSSVSTAQNPTHLFPSAGTYNVVLTVTNSVNESASLSQLVVVPLIASFSFQLFSVTVNGVQKRRAIFTDTSIGATAWDWDFGDGSPHSNAQNPSHDYALGGNYTALLTVTGGGQTSKATAIVAT